MEGLRYEVVTTIASGDFAVVYRARDRELGREVAIKQFHQQFLADGRRLARFWQESQLLASLQHPNILTVHDIVRSRGWLILELMQGSLLPAEEGEGLDLDYLRGVLRECLSALQLLHSHGVVHGDIKPSNLLVDSQGRVKLGDFGLARRANDEGGSLLKGTTKYMAPELLSPQFGPVGPASDLYSLGFSAYELMCGRQFETLFPGLDSFGRDKQIAWMMWHAAPDRNLPPIHRVLEGVPEDLARVIERLIVKDPSRRYQSAENVLWDLHSAPLTAAARQPDAAAEAARVAAAKRRRWKRYAAILVLSASLTVSVAMLQPSQPSPSPSSEPLQGTVTHVYPKDFRIAFRVAESKDGKQHERLEEIRLTPRYDKVFINDKPEPFDQVRLDDFVRVEMTIDSSGRRITEVYAYRPETASGCVKEIKADARQLVLSVANQRGQEEELVVNVPQELKVSFNGKISSFTFADLRPNDRILVQHIGTGAGREATELRAERVVTMDGIIRDVQINKRELTLEVSKRMVVLRLADQCEIAINNRTSINERRLKPGDLEPGDKATVAHDTRIVRISAERVLRDSGTIETVQAKAIDVVRGGEKKPTRYNIGADCTITFGGERVDLHELRKGDTVEITHRSLDRKNTEAVSVAARRAVDPGRWAIVIGIQDYEDGSISRLSYAVADAKLLHDSLVSRYQTSADQVLLLTDDSLVRLQQGILDRLAKLAADSKLLVFVTGHAYRNEEGKVYLAPKDFDPKRMSATGLPLQWLVDELEKCPAAEKLLLLDCSHAGKGADLASEPSTAEMIRSLKTPPGRAPLRTITAIASCGSGQRGVDWLEKRHGLFAWLLARGYAGEADKNRDNRLEPSELFGYLQEAMATSSERIGTSQTPELFLPDNRPPRLSEEAKAAIRKFANYVRQNHVDLSEAESEYAGAVMVAGKEIEPRLLYGLLLLKNKQRDLAQKQFDAIKTQCPDLLLPLQGTAWGLFEKRAYPSGVDALVELISKIPKSTKADSYSRSQQQVLYWAGQLREFVALAVDDGHRISLSALDAAVLHQNADARRLYEEGRAKSKAIHATFERQIATAESAVTAATRKIESRQVNRYVDFPYDQAVQQVLDGLDQ